MKITVKESSIVRPAEDTPTRRIWLSNLDLIQGNYYLPVVYMYKPDGSSDFFDVKLLKEALSKVLVPFYPFAGRYGRGENGRMEINCNGEGVLFVEAEADCPMSDLNDFTPGREYAELAPIVDCSTDISYFPFYLAQVTKFSCGGVCLGVSSHHQVVDGPATIHFTNSWSEAARGLSLTFPPVHERTLVRARDPPTPKFHHIEYDPIPIFKPKAKAEERLSAVILKLPLEFVNSLKAKVNSKETNVKYTTFEILSAHIWRCTSKSRNLSNDQANMLLIPVDGRQRLNPPLPKGYFGNAIFLATPTVSTGEMASESLEKTVERIHKAVTKMNDEYLSSGIDYLEKKNNNSKAPMNSVEPTFVVNSWVGLDVACTDFGWGKPYMRPAGEFGGAAVLMPSSNTDDNNLSVCVCLPDENIQSLKKLLCALE